MNACDVHVYGAQWQDQRDIQVYVRARTHMRMCVCCMCMCVYVLCVYMYVLCVCMCACVFVRVFVPILKFPDEIVAVGFLGGLYDAARAHPPVGAGGTIHLHYVLAREGYAVLHTIHNVLTHSAAKQLCVLCHQPALIVHVLQAELAEVCAVEEDVTAAWVVEPHHEVHKRGLATAAFAHQCACLPGRNLEADALQYLSVGAHLIPKKCTCTCG